MLGLLQQIFPQVSQGKRQHELWSALSPVPADIDRKDLITTHAQDLCALDGLIVSQMHYQYHTKREWPHFLFTAQVLKTQRLIEPSNRGWSKQPKIYGSVKQEFVKNLQCYLEMNYYFMLTHTARCNCCVAKLKCIMHIYLIVGYFCILIQFCVYYFITIIFQS